MKVLIIRFKGESDYLEIKKDKIEKLQNIIKNEYLSTQNKNVTIEKYTKNELRYFDNLFNDFVIYKIVDIDKVLKEYDV